MIESIIAILVGVLCIVLGIFNCKGKINSVHSYHRRRVTEENKLAFGKKIGLGTIIIGGSISLFGVCSFITHFVESAALSLIGVIVIILGVFVGFGISIYAMIKYNKGIF